MQLLWIGAAEAKVVSINIHRTTNSMGAGEVAGVVPVANWNNVFNIGSFVDSTGNDLKDSNGFSTSIDFTGNGRGGNSEELVVTEGNSNATMMSGQGFSSIRPADGGAGEYVAQAQMTNVLSEMGPNYSLYVYFGTACDCLFMGGTGTMILSTGEYNSGANGLDPATTNVPTATLVTSKAYTTMRGSSGGFGEDPTWDDNTGFIESTGAGVDHKGNYVVFDNLNLDNLVVTMNPDSLGYQWNQNNFLGLQLVSGGAVPEPSTLALAGIGLVGLVGYGLRRRRR